MGFRVNNPELLETTRKIHEALEQQAKRKKKKQATAAIFRAIGKWVANNIIPIGALIVSIIALLRTF